MADQRVKEAEKEYRDALNTDTTHLSLRKRVEEMRSGEKATKYFCNLMKNQAAQKYILKLINDDGSETQCQGEVEETIREFYEKLYSNQEDELMFNSIEEFFGTDCQNHKRLNDRQRDFLENEITIDELGAALKGTKKKSSPGATGFTYPFFKMFWPRLKYLIHAAFK